MESWWKVGAKVQPAYGLCKGANVRGIFGSQVSALRYRYGLSGAGAGAGQNSDPEPVPEPEHLNLVPDGRDLRPEVFSYPDPYLLFSGSMSLFSLVQKCNPPTACAKVQKC